MYLGIIVFIVLNIVLSSNADDLYPSYNLSIDRLKVFEWSNNPALAYIKTARLFDYDHHIFQYRRYPCQYFYTDEIQLFYNNETLNQCLYNTTNSDYEYSFQLHFDSRHIEPYILQNIAIQCAYINCSLSLLNITFINIGWNFRGRENNLDCSFDTDQPYNIIHTPYTVSELITLRCKSLSACNHSQSNIEQFLPSYIRLIYGSSYELQMPYCSLEKSLSYVMNTNFAQTNDLLRQIIDLMQRNSVKTDGGEQEQIKEYTEHVSNITKNIENN